MRGGWSAPSPIHLQWTHRCSGEEIAVQIPLPWWSTSRGLSPSITRCAMPRAGEEEEEGGGGWRSLAHSPQRLFERMALGERGVWVRGG